MKIYISIVFLFLFLNNSEILKANYSIDLQKIDKAISVAQEVDFTNEINLNTYNQQNNREILVQKNPFIAWLLTYTIVGFHRLYLGTEFGTFAAYFFTLGGFLIIDIIDYAVLLAAMIDHRPIDKYVGNPKFFMWN